MLTFGLVYVNVLAIHHDELDQQIILGTELFFDGNACILMELSLERSTA